ncbi:uncharacterized protein LY89DRAFT_737794 [Mollisia scopiformis]|uniref:Uncharacterized protein n=1 Tax=Mollisia scopiformis TaxID=149040 RepID=A0A194WYX7_MOLSC|nr:uncharacterized protein LY89DRAFT_737794 [Mollisia scopiformis]KUJ12894.1 hypothetical protein LY89DRAFT_737794 [Mollisia scopiformis]
MDKTSAGSKEHTQGDLAVTDDPTGSTSNKTAPAQGFEWIAHGDASARRRARAHVTRGFRRAKAAQAQLEKGGDVVRKKGKKSKSISPPESESGSSTSSPAESTPIYNEEVQVAPSAVVVQNLGAGLGSGRTDPFSSLPVNMSPDAYALLDHYFFGMAPLSFAGDQRSNFQPVKSLIFNVGLADSSVFHLVLSAAAKDIAYIRGQEESQDVVRHRGIALELIKKRVLDWQASSADGTLVAVALLAGTELLFGTPQNYNTHMAGLETMLNLRGGLEAFRETNPQLYSIVCWFDCSGSCNLLSKRRFTPIKYVPDLLYTAIDGVPEKILQGLPVGYDLFKELVSMFEGMHNVTSLVQSSGDHIHERPEFIVQSEAELYKTLCMPDTEGVRSRRRHIHQSLLILPLVYMALVSEYEGASAELFLYRFQKVLAGDAAPWGEAVANLFRTLLVSEPWESRLFAMQISLLVDVCTTLEWQSWREIKSSLLQFFIYDPACHGPMQESWKNRIITITK